MGYFLGIDLGASSGRHIVGYDDLGEYKTVEVHRFENKYIEYNGHLIWDLEYLFIEVIRGIRKAINEFGKIDSLSIDSWGCDYVLMNDDQVILPCYAYRDSRTKDVIEDVLKLCPKEYLYERTGIQFQEFNTIFQLYDDLKKGRLDKATDFLMIPEYLIYKLTGKKVKEYTNATTTGLINLNTKEFDQKIISKLRLPKSLFPTLTKSPSVVADLTLDIMKVVGLNVPVVLGPTHDTASAVEAIEYPDIPYISSGTWSLLGVRVKEGINTLESMENNWSNEGGIGYIRYQKNIMGLWIIQNLHKEIKIIIEKMVILAKTSNYQEIFDVNDPIFLAPTSMKEAIIKWFEDRNIIAPASDADIINSVYHSLAYSYGVAIKELEKNTSKRFKQLVIVGGGAKNKYLNDLTAKYTNLEVIALPIEASAIGNLKNQAIAISNYVPNEKKQKSIFKIFKNN